MKHVLSLLLFFIHTPVAAEVNCNLHKIYCKIIDLRPNINKKEAMLISNQIYKQAKKYKSNPILSIAIAMQETGIRQKSKSHSFIKFYKKCHGNSCFEDWYVEKGISDVCMFQIHTNTILHYNIDPVKLKNNLSYCVEWHFKIMKIKKRECKHLAKPWGCYHSKSKILRNQYIKLVERYL